MGRNRVTPNRGTMVADCIRPIDPREIDRPHGRYTIEFFDDLTGRRLHREVKDNYITPNYERYMERLQYYNHWASMPLPHSSVLRTRAYTSQSSYLPPSELFPNALMTDRFYNPEGNVSLPMDSVVLTNDESAEDSGDPWMRGIVAAYAHRWKGNVAASGARGQINEAESAFSNNGNTHKTVWDWTTQQGNGTFLTIGIASMLSHNSATLWCGYGPKAILLDNSMTNRGSAAAEPWSRMLSNPVFHGGNMYFLAPGGNAAGSNNINLYSLSEAAVMSAAAFDNDELVQNARGLTPTLVCDTGIDVFHADSSGENEPNLGWRLGLARLSGGDFVMSYGYHYNASTNRPVMARRFTTAGAAVWTNTNIGPSGIGTSYQDGYTGIAVDGSDNVYVMINGVTNIYRCNPATGALSATIPLPSEYGSTYIHGMAVHPDGDLLIGTTIGVCKMTVGGTATSPYCYGRMGSGAWQATDGLSPWTTGVSAGYIGTQSRNNSAWHVPYAGDPPMTYVDDSSPDYYRPALGLKSRYPAIGNVDNVNLNHGPIFIHGGRMWMVCGALFSGGSIISAGSTAFISVVGANMFSKTVLDSPRTKVNSQNMKVSYELTWPTGNVAATVDHPSLV
jgi:hypothetical protein